MDKYRFLIYVPGMPVTPDVLENRSLGGSESAGAYLARALVRRGHEVALFANVPEPAAWAGVPILPIGAPTEAAPLGELFEQRARTVRHDVLLLQREVRGPTRTYNGKLTFFWAHDLARSRVAGIFNRGAWRYDGVLAVSAWHADQFARTYDYPREHVHVLRNAPDLDLFQVAPDVARKHAARQLVYVSRPERGLGNLVGEGGVMEKLARYAPDATLLLAHYDNTTAEMAPLYQHLWGRALALPNVKLLGPLSKRGVAELMRDATLWVYPTVPAFEFEETSCVAAMEASAAGAVPVVCPNGALPETLARDVGPERAVYVPYRPDGATDVDGFTRAILDLLGDGERYAALSAAAREHALATYRIEESAATLEGLVSEVLRTRSRGSRLFNHLLYQADAVLARRLFDAPPPELEGTPVLPFAAAELGRYAYLRDAESYREFYARERPGARLDDPALYPTDLLPLLGELAAPRFAHAVELVERVARRGDGGSILEYGCGHGHLLLALAARYPRHRFTGVELNAALADRASAEAKQRNLENISFASGAVFDREREAGQHYLSHDLVLCLETLEHVRDEPDELLAEFERFLRAGGWVGLSFPASQPDWARPVPETREHVRFLEPADLRDILGSEPRPDYREDYYDAGPDTPAGEPTIGVSVSWRVLDRFPPGKVDVSRKLRTQAPRETLAVGIITRAETATLARTLASVREVADRIIVRVDGGDADAPELDEASAAARAARAVGAEVFAGPSPLRVGFAAARNETVARAEATGFDWFLWIDDDETLVWPERLAAYLRPNGFDAYALHHHHLSAEPVGLLRTDLPTRLFRLGRGFTFHGLVHEHPELGPVNTGPGHVYLVPHERGNIMHVGYETDDVRVKRFERNWPLLQRDQVENPQRRLGQMLYLRDLGQQVRFEVKRTQRVTPAARRYGELAVAAFRNLLAAEDARLAADALPYYTEAVAVLTGGRGLVLEVASAASRLEFGERCDGAPLPPLRGMFIDQADARAFAALQLEMKLQITDGRYY